MHGPWLCGNCTFANDAEELLCTMCDARRSEAVKRSDVESAAVSAGDDDLPVFRPPSDTGAAVGVARSPPSPLALLDAVERRVAAALTGCTETERLVLLRFVMWMDRAMVPVLTAAVNARFDESAPMARRHSSVSSATPATVNSTASAVPAARPSRQPTSGAAVTTAAPPHAPQVTAAPLKAPEVVATALPPVSLSLCDLFEHDSDDGRDDADDDVDDHVHISDEIGKGNAVKEEPSKFADPGKQRRAPKKVSVPSSSPELVATREGVQGEGDEEARVLYLLPLDHNPVPAFEVRSSGPAVVVRRGNKECDAANVYVDDKSVSLQHCELRFDHSLDKFMVRDTSSNGTRINNKRLQKDSEHQLKPHDRLQLAKGEFLWVASDVPRRNSKLGSLIKSRGSDRTVRKSSASVAPESKPHSIIELDDDEAGGNNTKNKGAPLASSKRRRGHSAESEPGSRVV